MPYSELLVSTIICEQINKKFWDAHSARDYAVLNFLIDNGVDIEMVDKDGRSPLKVAFTDFYIYESANNLKMIEFLLSKGAIFKEEWLDSKYWGDRLSKKLLALFKQYKGDTNDQTMESNQANAKQLLE